MAEPDPSFDLESALREMLGYLNFSSGKQDARFQRHVNDCYARLGTEKPWAALERRLIDTLQAVRGATPAFRQVGQAEAVVGLVFGRVLPAYRAHHRDLLSHLSDADLFSPFFVARVFQAVLGELGPWDEPERIIGGALDRLNDYVGYRPVAVLERQKCEPYEHERVRPIPLFIRGAGTATGAYHDLVERALAILNGTDRELLADAHFDLALLDELALDPRAYDFSHPVNQRPNYQFGEWDPHAIDNQGRYRRFIVRQELLDALLERVQGSEFRVQHRESKSAAVAEPRTLRAELLFEAAAVLAGTMLMAAGTSGSGPEAHDSTVTLATLVPKIARYRDEFYSNLMDSVGGAHGERLRAEAQRLHQPFGGARQGLNQALARRRADQLRNSSLAILFVEMGYADAGRERVRLVAAASARIATEIVCSLLSSHRHADRGETEAAVRAFEAAEDLLHRGIGCGAIVDPWNILGFQGQFSIFAALENTVPDPRVDDLTSLVNQIFNLLARLLADAAAAGNAELERRLHERFQKLAAWWDQFATVEVGGIDRVHGGESLAAATHVATALADWRRAGEAAGDLRFWRERTEAFNTPRAYTQVVRALIEKRDHVAAIALLISWLGRANEVPLEQELDSFREMAVWWLQSVLRLQQSGAASPETESTALAADAWPLVKKFFDYLEANAEEYWLVPSLELGKNVTDLEDTDYALDRDDADEPDDEDGAVYSAAYNGVTYRDSAEDGHEGEVIDGAAGTDDFELEATLDRLEPRLQFLATLAILWRDAAAAPLPEPPRDLIAEHAGESVDPSQRHAHPERAAGTGERARIQESWLKQLLANQRDLERLADEIQRAPLPPPDGSHDSLVEYDRRRFIKEQLIYEVIDTLVESKTAARRLLRCCRTTPADVPLAEWERLATELEHALVRGHADHARAVLPPLASEFASVPLLYRRLDRGGDARAIICARVVQQTLRLLVRSLPRAGLIRETYRLLATALEMERQHPVGGEGITEFNHLFRAAFQSVVEGVLDASTTWTPYEQSDQPLLKTLDELTRPFLRLWVEHSQTVRLSALDRVRDDGEWREIQAFIQRYGRDLLTPKFLTPANLRAILDRGCDRFLDYLAENQDPLHPARLVAELGGKISRARATRLLELIIQVFVENHAEYSDYNATTTQSDYGERYFILFEFLQVKALYERAFWNLLPVSIGHECLARAGRSDAARAWSAAIAQRSAALADEVLRQLGDLEHKHGVRIGTIRDRLNERFVRPLALNHATVLIEPAIAEASGPSAPPQEGAFSRLVAELSEFGETPVGAGIGVPDWLHVLEAEVDRVIMGGATDLEAEDGEELFAPLRLTMKDLRDQLDHWDE